MLYNVPQFIDVEDKIAGPLTWRQLLWMIGMTVVLMVLWNIFEPSYFFVNAAFIVPIFVAFAFYRPYGQPLIKMVFFGIVFLFNPRSYTWKQTGSVMQKSIRLDEQDVKKKTNDNMLSLDEIVNVSKILDNPSESLTREMKNDSMKK